jgi:hypothetical protein
MSAEHIYCRNRPILPLHSAIISGDASEVTLCVEGGKQKARRISNCRTIQPTPGFPNEQLNITQPAKLAKATEFLLQQLLPATCAPLRNYSIGWPVAPQSYNGCIIDSFQFL